MVKDMVLETDRLILRRYRQGDLQDLYEYLSDGEVRFGRIPLFIPCSKDKSAPPQGWGGVFF